MDEMMKMEAMMMDAMVDVMFDWARGRHSSSPCRSGLLQAQKQKRVNRRSERLGELFWKESLGTAE